MTDYFVPADDATVAMRPGHCPLGCPLVDDRLGSCAEALNADARLCGALGALVCARAYQAWAEAGRPFLPAGERVAASVALPATALPPIFRDAPDRLEAWTLLPETDQQHERQAAVREQARTIAADWRRLPDQPWLLLLGRPGTGKTLLLRILGRLALEAGRTVRYTVFTDLIDDIKKCRAPDSGRTEASVVQGYLEPDLLIIDEVRPGHGDDIKNEDIAHDIIRRRYGHDLGEPHKATWLACNLSIKELIGVIGLAALDRFLENGNAPHLFTWPSYR